MTSNGQTRGDWVVLAAILALALGLRVIGLNTPLWYDEIVTLETHLRLPWGRMMSEYAMNHHYFFSLQAKAAMAAFGEAPWVLRLPSMLFGVASIAAMWWLARRWVGVLQAHVTALLLALSYHHIWFSQNARGYTGLMFWSVLGTILFVEGLRQRRLWIWLAYAVVLALAVYTHLTGIFFFVAHGVAWLGWLALRAVRGEVVRADVVLPALGFALGLVLTALVYAPVIPGILAGAAEVAGTSAVDAMQEYQNPLWTIAETLRTALGGAGAVVLLAGAAVFGTIALGAVQLRKRAPLVAPVTALHIVITMGLLLALGMRIWPRFFFVDIGFLLLLIVAGACAIAGTMARVLRGWPGGLGHRRPLFLIGSTLMVLLSAGLAVRNYTAPKQDLAGAYAFVEAERRAGDRVVVLGVTGKVFRDHFGADWTLVDPDGQLVRAEGDGATWVVMGFPARTTRAYEPMLQGFDQAFNLARAFPGTLGDGRVLVYRSR